MPNDTQHSSRLSGGLFGVIALALAGSGAGVIGYWTLGGDNTEQAEPAARPIPEGIADNTVGISDTDISDVSELEDPAFETVDGPNRLPAETGTIVDDASVSPPVVRPDAPPKPEPKLPPKPNPRVLKEAAFVVRFTDNQELDRLVKQYRGDKEGTRAAFAKWAAKHPELNGLTLARVNYSGEVILNYRGEDDTKPAISAKEIQARLNELPFVRYADPDFTAFPGKGD